MRDLDFIKGGVAPLCEVLLRFGLSFKWLVGELELRLQRETAELICFLFRLVAVFVVSEGKSGVLI